MLAACVKFRYCQVYIQVHVHRYHTDEREFEHILGKPVFSKRSRVAKCGCLLNTGQFIMSQNATLEYVIVVFNDIFRLTEALKNRVDFCPGSLVGKTLN